MHGSLHTLIGQEVDGYRIEEELGRGGFGVVYRGIDETLGRSVAIKFVLDRHVTNDKFAHRFRQEAKILAQIKHPHIITVYRARETKFGFCYVMEYVEGHTLKEHLQTHGLYPWAEAIPLMLTLLDAFAYAHNKGIIHRDVKPGNILLTPDGGVKVLDFGLAKTIFEGGEVTTADSMQAGTLYYMSPEQARGLRQADQRSDLFSLGLTFFEMLTGKLPFDKGSSVFDVMKAIIEEPFPDLSQMNAAIPQPLAQIVMKAIEKEPEQRFQRAEEMAEALRAFAQESSPQRAFLTPNVQAAPVAAAMNETAVTLTSPPIPAPKRGLSATLTPERSRRMLSTVWLVLIPVVLAAVLIMWLLGPFRTGSRTATLAADSLALMTVYPLTSADFQSRVNWTQAPVAQWTNIRIEKNRVVAVSLHDAGLTEVPDALTSLDALTALNLSSNQLTTLPPDISAWTQLQELHLWKNQLTALPPEVGELEQLQRLYLWKNQLSTLPPTVQDLNRLEVLTASFNPLTAVPPELGTLPQLRVLVLSYNQLTALPFAASDLPALQTLDLRYNPSAEVVALSFGL